MHKVELRLTNEGNDTNNVFELYTEALLDDKGYAESGPMQSVAGGGAPVVLFLEADERIIVVAKGNKGQLVFDKEQNANVRVETEDERKWRAEADAKKAQQQANQAVAAANAKVQETRDSGKRAEDDAKTEVKRTEDNAAKLAEQQAKDPAATSEQMPLNKPLEASNTGVAGGRGSASANTGPIDSKQVKAETPAQSSPK